MLLALLAIAVFAATDECELKDEEGRPFPVCFDPGNGLEVGAGWLGRGTAAVETGPAFSAGVLLRTERESRSKKGSLWFNEQRIFITRAQPGWLLVHGYQATYRRHLKEGFILVPTKEPTRLPFPFDIALSLSIGRYERRVFEGSGFTVEVGRAAVLLDPIRAETGRVRLAVGPSFGYLLRHDGTQLSQELTPFTSGQVEAGFESEDGWWNARLVAIAGGVYTPGQDRLTFRARGEASVQRILIAVNDQPVHLEARVSGANDAGVVPRTEWTASVGLVVRAFSP